MRFYPQSIAVLTAALMTPSATLGSDVSTNLRRSDVKSKVQRKLLSSTPFSMQSCQDTFLGMDKMYRDDLSDQVFHWADMELTADQSLATEKLSALMEADDTDHFPDFHTLPGNVREVYVVQTCPYFFAEVAQRFAISQGTATMNMRFCLDPSFHKRCPAKLYLAIDKVKEYGTQNVVEKICTAIGEALDETKADLMFRYEASGLVTSTLRSQAQITPHRFNKIKWDNAPADITRFDMTSATYPITQAIYDSLRFTSAVSPVLPTDRNLIDDIDDIGTLEQISVKVMEGPPAQPEEERFWPLMHHMIKLQNHRRSNGNDLGSTIFTVPDLWKDMTINDCADNVHDEYPVAWQIAYLTDQFDKKALKVDTTIIPQLSGIDFINSVVCFSHISAWSAKVISATSFAMKWHAGRMRPEEAMLAIKEGRMDDIKDIIPDDIMDDIMAMDITTGPGFTAYPEGSPGHPSWPAMHSVGSSLSMWLPVVCNLTDEQWEQAKLTDHAVAYSRSIAGVHYYDDNIAGLAMGQALVAAKLPEFLNQEYGANIAAVRQKVAEKRFDWFQFAPELFDSPTEPGVVP